MQPKTSKYLSIETRIKAIIGVNTHERTNPQLLLISLSIEEIYEAQHLRPNFLKLLKEYTDKHQPKLLETMAYQLAKLIKENFNIPRFTLTIKKPEAIKDAECSYIRLSVG
jgi:dihydroneopterin aldolase